MLAPRGWMRHVWESLGNTPLTLRGHDLTFPTQRLGDRRLMDCFIEAGYDQDTVLVLQDCRLYLQAVTLSNICTADGLCIAPQAWEGKHNDSIHQPRWINTYTPKKAKWNLWRQVLRSLFLIPNS